ncbi:amino acid/amide ABC transporter ATP-binding protein 2, HAAT family [Tistlia consotensis]|uniref:Amino acid/amide ABC transporter ATP-binding protein 2, HAAT family n=1 Tax=Tistlia consotensis USBA 355 TaxID=560819 RepID=A0A1Y6BZ37_9PROT|nr:ABC transporter ATP-binding protein [Tistlia consotensis]SMF36882.1 amino acid/amide ABC transporter ATP-binding protein 2, HAAT family [Tistlia consotensis USBA 355]SNR72253.1 amino acid/amide ABC transporter ATP-binding protein 2, HAAT family [Tistlia consotensis]
MILEVRGLSIHYGGICAVDGLSFGIETGSIVAILGANGAGKSSLLKAFMGVCPGRLRGEILLDGAPLGRAAPDRIVRAGLALSPEGRQLFAGLSVAENLAMGAYLRRDAAGVKRDREDILALFPRLRERLRQLAGTLSGGEQQMVAVGRALMSAPRLLLLDEPTLGLAPLVIDEIMALVGAIRDRGITVVLVEQNASKALARSDHAHVMEKGRIVMSGPARELASNEEIVSAYLGTA